MLYLKTALRSASEFYGLLNGSNYGEANSAVCIYTIVDFPSLTFSKL